MLSVSEVLELSGVKDNMVGSDYHLWVGRAAHRAVELYVKGELDDSTIDEQVRPRLNAYIKFAKSTGFKMTASEVPIFNAVHNLAGTPDLVGVFPDGSEGIIDLKSGVVAPWTRLQLAGYDFILGATKTGSYRVRYGLSVPQSGEPKVMSCWIPDDMTTFRSCLNVAQWKVKQNKTWRKK
jgi:hypothetical protein